MSQENNNKILHDLPNRNELSQIFSDLCMQLGFQSLLDDNILIGFQGN